MGPVTGDAVLLVQKCWVLSSVLARFYELRLLG